MLIFDSQLIKCFFLCEFLFISNTEIILLNKKDENKFGAYPKKIVGLYHQIRKNTSTIIMFLSNTHTHHHIHHLLHCQSSEATVCVHHSAHHQFHS